MGMEKGFRQRVLFALLEIPDGKVTTYGAIAKRLGNKNLSRAVGNALHHNPDGKRFPCYRVVDAKGRLSKAFAFGGEVGQKARLTLDGIEVQDGKVDLSRFGYFYE